MWLNSAGRRSFRPRGRAPRLLSDDRYPATYSTRKRPFFRTPLNLPTASSRDQHWRAGCLDFLPLLDGGAIKAPVAPDAEARKPSLTQQPVNCRGVNAKMIGKLFNGEDFVLGRHVDTLSQQLGIAPRALTADSTFRLPTALYDG